jgi:hypothetical protein
MRAVGLRGPTVKGGIGSQLFLQEPKIPTSLRPAGWGPGLQGAGGWKLV